MSAPEPGSPEWLSLMSASKIAAAIGVSPWQSPWGLWHEMKGLVPPPTQTPEMERGQILEAAVLAWWRLHHPDGEMYRRAYRLGEWALATPEATVKMPDGTVALIEAKTTASWDEWGQAGTDEIPAYYYTQCVWQMACCAEASMVYVPVLGPFLGFREYVIARDDQLIEQLVAKARKFYESLSSDTPPPLDDHVATIGTLRRMHPDIDQGSVAVITQEQAEEYIDADVALAAAEARLRGARAVLLDTAGTSQYIQTPTGERIARRQASGRGIALRRIAKTIKGE